MYIFFVFFFQAEDGIRDHCVTGVQTCALPILITMACASGGSSVRLTSMLARVPGGVIAARRAAAPPVSSMVGLPPGRLITPMSRQYTPLRKPVPSALAQASLAA